MMRQLIIFIGIFAILFPEAAQTSGQVTVKRTLRLMGSRFEITAIGSDTIAVLDAINAGIIEIERIEGLISSWIPDSETSLINAAAGRTPVAVSKELFELIRRSLKVSDLTAGTFDITAASMDPVWKFDRSEQKFPAPDKVQAAAEKIDYRDIELNNQQHSVLLKKSGMKIGFGAIGKGYAANRAKRVMQKKGITDGLVNAGGDLIAWGQPADGKRWRIGIADPGQPEKMLAWLEIDSGAVVTSGDYEKYFLCGGKRFAHIIDPRNGYPVTGIKSVTILCPDAELADALATAVFVLGKIRGMELLNRLKAIEGLIVTDKNTLITSKNLQLNYYSDREIPQTNTASNNILDIK